MRGHSVVFAVVLAIRYFNKQIIMQPDFRKRSPRGGVRRQERSLRMVKGHWQRLIFAPVFV